VLCSFAAWRFGFGNRFAKADLFGFTAKARRAPGFWLNREGREGREGLSESGSEEKSSLHDSHKEAQTTVGEATADVRIFLDVGDRWAADRT
jgi:hypothetical protein